MCFPHAWALQGEPYWQESYDAFGWTGWEYKRQLSKCQKCGKERAKSIGGKRAAARRNSW